MEETKVKMRNEKTKQFEHKLTFDKIKIIMTEEEHVKLNEAHQKYIETHGVTFGFVRWLLGGVSE